MRVNADQVQGTLVLEAERETLQASASRGQSLVPIMAIMSNTMNTCLYVYVCVKGVPHPKKQLPANNVCESENILDHCEMLCFNV